MVFRLVCADSSIAIRPVFERFRNVIITSGTLSPLTLYPKLLGFEPRVSMSFEMTQPPGHSAILPLTISRVPAGGPLSTRFESRQNKTVVRDYGKLLANLSATVPDGMVAFFPSYQYMEEAVTFWHDEGVLAQILEHKLVFVETKDVVETTLALDNYRRACDCGRGALFLSVARGKVAEGVNFERHYGRCVVLIGIPYQCVSQIFCQTFVCWILRISFCVRYFDSIMTELYTYFCSKYYYIQK